VPPIRFRIQTIMIVIAVSAMMMASLRLPRPLFFLLLIVVVQVLLFVLAIAGIPCLFAAYDWYIQRRSRQLTRETETGRPRYISAPNMMPTSGLTSSRR
jgi:hypothetical protein